VNGIAYSADGTTIASAADGGLQLWDTVTGRPRGAPLLRANARVFAVGFGPDDLLATADETAAILWTLDGDGLTASACNVANRNLTRTEWDKFIGPHSPYSRTCVQDP
jgi:hypothetical protein